MKNNIIAFLTLTLLMGLQGCKKDFLEVQPVMNQSEESYYKTEDQAFLALTAVYQTMAVQNGLEFLPIASDIHSDDEFAGGSSATDMVQWHQMESSTMTAESKTADEQWNRCYSGIYRANLLLSKLDQITWKSPANKARIEAEAKFCRAHFYWDLVRQFGWVPIILTNLDLAAYRSLPQVTPEVVYKQIASDLLAAANGLPATVSSSEAGRATRYAAKALLARIYLYYQGFAKPVLGITSEWSDGVTVIDKKMAQDAVDSIVIKGGYQLLPDYASVFAWDNQNNAESIFELQYSEKGKCGNWGADYWDVYGNMSVQLYGIRDPDGDNTIDKGWSFGTVSWSLVNEFETGDTRKDASVYDAGAKLNKYTKGYQNTGYFNKKYMPLKAYEATGGGDPVLNWNKNYIEIRLADVLLMGSELFLTDDAAKSLDYFNRVRARAMGDIAKKSSITIDDIYHERRVELAGEGQRFWDLLRRGLDYTQQKIQASVTLPDGITNASDFQDIKFDKTTYGMYPIPAHEIRNTNSGVLKQFIPAYQ